MDENNNIGTTNTSTDYVIGGATPTVEPTPVSEPAPAVASAPATEPVPAAAPTPATEPTPQPATSTANVYEQANSAATNPTPAKPIEDTPIYTTSTSTTSSSADSYSVPVAPTYASTDSTYSSTYDSTSSEPTSNGLAIASLILGIVSIILSCCCCGNILFSIGGIVCGCLQKPTADGKKPGMATAGIITSIVGIVAVIIFTALGALFGESIAELSNEFY